MAESKIEWTDRSDWNPIRGCTRVSPGCGGPGPHGGCYAEAIAARFSDPGQAFHSFAERTKSGPRWTGKVELQEDRLTLPLRWKKPARIFASSTSDIFHEALPDEAIDKIFAVMALSPQHTFQILSKRSARMREYLTDRDPMTWARAHKNHPPANPAVRWRNPLPNVWLGVSVEDQARADERIPDLLATPAAGRFISAEPLLGPVDLDEWMQDGIPTQAQIEHPDPFRALHYIRHGSPRLDWIIAGGESGPKARPAHPDWFRSLRDQCQAAGVPFFFKQWGEWAPYDRGRVNSAVLASPGCLDKPVQRFGKKAAGRLLDGRAWGEMPNG